MYNEIEPFAAQWLRNLEANRHIAPGRIDTRSITELQPNEIDSPQFHAFAGIGVWSHALRIAGYRDAWNVWTGSCPCQPFSQAGRRAAKSDARHLWPEWFRLIRERRPRVVLGEQVASPLGLGWLDSVSTDLEGEGYAFGASDLCAAGFSAPHIRQRLYFGAIRSDGLAHHHQGRRQEFAQARVHVQGQCGNDTDGRGESRGLGHSDLHGGWWNGRTGTGSKGGVGLRAVSDGTGASGSAGRLGDACDACDAGPQGFTRHVNHGDQPRRLDPQSSGPTPKTGPADWEWLYCRDGKWRPTQPGLQPLAHGATQRVGRLRAYGNAIEVRTATAFLQALKPQVEDFLRAP